MGKSSKETVSSLKELYWLKSTSSEGETTASVVAVCLL